MKELILGTLLALPLLAIAGENEKVFRRYTKGKLNEIPTGSKLRIIEQLEIDPNTDVISRGGCLIELKIATSRRGAVLFPSDKTAILSDIDSTVSLPTRRDRELSIRKSVTIYLENSDSIKKFECFGKGRDPETLSIEYLKSVFPEIELGIDQEVDSSGPDIIFL